MAMTIRWTQYPFPGRWSAVRGSSGKPARAFHARVLCCTAAGGRIRTPDLSQFPLGPGRVCALCTVCLFFNFFFPIFGWLRLTTYQRFFNFFFFNIWLREFGENFHKISKISQIYSRISWIFLSGNKKKPVQSLS